MLNSKNYSFWYKSLFVLVETEICLLTSILSDVTLRYLMRLVNVQIKSGNAGEGTAKGVTCEQYNLILDLLISAAIMPTIEEIIYRLAPLVFMRQVLKIEQSLALNLMTSAVFALCHNVTWNLSNITASQYHHGWIPLPQFIAGLFLWHIARKYGVVYSIASHGLINLVLTLARFSTCL